MIALCDDTTREEKQMTKYNKKMYQADLCTIAASRCYNKGHKSMAMIWQQHAAYLRECALTMTVAEAQSAAN